MNRQRLSLSSCLLVIVLASIGSRYYFDGIGGYIAPLMAPALLSPRFFGPLSLSVFWLVLFGVGVIAWRRCSARFTYSLVSLVVLLVLIGEFTAYRYAHAE
jgi:hypothetical protein